MGCIPASGGSIPDATLRSRSVTPVDRLLKIGSGIKIVAFGNQNCCVVALQPWRRCWERQ